MAHRIITPPSVEPIPIEELRLHLRDPSELENDLILGYLSAAREYVEKFVGFAIAPQTWEVALDYFPCGAIELPGGLVGEVISVSYVDENGDVQAYSALEYSLDNYSTPNWLLPAYDTSWPSTYAVANAVKVRYTVGSQPLSPSIRAALLLMVGHLYENREEANTAQTFSVPMGVHSLLTLHRVNMGV